MLVDMDPCETFAIILLSRNQNADKRTLSCSFATEHGNLNALFHVLKNIPIDWDLNHKTMILYTLPNFFDLYLRVLVPRHVKQDWECFLHLITWDPHADTIVLYTKSVKSSAEPLVQAENHLGGQVVYPVQSRVV